MRCIDPAVAAQKARARRSVALPIGFDHAICRAPIICNNKQSNAAQAGFRKQGSRTRIEVVIVALLAGACFDDSVAAVVGRRSDDEAEPK